MTERQYPWSANWIIHRPDAHPHWSDYFIYIMSLEDVPGLGAAHKYADDRTHELAIWAVHPDCKNLPNGKVAPDVVKALNEAGDLRIMSPPNYVFQFRYPNNESAEQFAIFHVIEPLASKRMNPDTDAKSVNEPYLTGLGGLSGRIDPLQSSMMQVNPNAD